MMESRASRKRNSFDWEGVNGLRGAEGMVSVRVYERDPDASNYKRATGCGYRPRRAPSPDAACSLQPAALLKSESVRRHPDCDDAAGLDRLDAECPRTGDERVALAAGVQPHLARASRSHRLDDLQTDVGRDVEGHHVDRTGHVGD